MKNAITNSNDVTLEFSKENKIKLLFPLRKCSFLYSNLILSSFNLQ